MLRLADVQLQLLAWDLPELQLDVPLPRPACLGAKEQVPLRFNNIQHYTDVFRSETMPRP